MTKMARYVKDNGDSEKPYLLLDTIKYYSVRYKKHVIVTKGERSDGASGAFDIISEVWWVHDELCNTGRFADGTLCTNWQASMIAYDILKRDGRWFRARSWFIMTWLFGGGKARDNGMW